MALLGGGGVAYAFVGTPGTGEAPVTDNPDLVSVTLANDNIYGTREAARYCFDEQLKSGAGAFNAANFFVKTYDADRFLAGVTANIVPEDGRCVEITFNPRVDLASQASIGETNAGAAQNLASRANYFSSAPVTGSTLKQVAGRTTGPDLVGATPRSTDTTVTFEFDQPIDPTNANIVQNSFGVVSDSGVEALGDNAVVPQVTDDRRRVTIAFPAGTDVTGAARSFVRAGAVRTLPQDGITGGAGPATTAYTLNPDGAVGSGTTSRPVLTAAEVRADGSSQIALTYSSDVSDTFVATGLVAVLDDGNVEAATAVTPISGSTTQVLAKFAPTGSVAREPGAVVAVVSKTGAAKTRTGAQNAPISEIALGAGAPASPGFTNAPDLLTTQVDTTSSQAVFNYDEPVDPDAIGAASSFVLLVKNGPPLAGTGTPTVSADRKQVFVQYAGSVSAAVGVGSGQGAVRDRLGNPSPYSSVSTTNVALPPTGTTTTTPPVTTPPVTTPPPVVTPTKKTYSTKVSVKRSGSTRKRKYSGKVSASASTCKVGRTVTLYKKGSSKRIATAKSKSSGSYTFKTRKRPGSKVYVKVSTKRTSTATCKAKTSKTISG